MDVRKRAQIVLSLTEDEASELITLTNFIPYGVCKIADQLSNDLGVLGITDNTEQDKKLAKALKVKP